MKMTFDPWCTQENELTGTSTLNNDFEDNFVNRNSLPDSAVYLETLEKKLARVKRTGKGTVRSKEIVESLEETRKDCIARLLAEDQFSEVVDDEDIPTKWLRNYINPQQPLTVGELIELVKADYLAQNTEKDLQEEPN